MRKLAGRILREPLVHFAIIGLALFIGAGVVKASQRPVIRIDSEELSQLSIYWELQMQRPPTQAELQGIIKERIDEEILSREALRLGLDKNDMIIRRRLAQKMAFASEDTTPVPEPSETQLRAFYDKSPDVYASGSRFSIQHVFFSDDRKSGDPRRVAEQALGLLRQGRNDIAGDPFVLPSTYADISLEDLEKDYGASFSAAVAQAQPGMWFGPVKSAYGWHLVRVDSRHASVVQPFVAVRAQVREAWMTAQREALNTASLDKLRKRYRVFVTSAEAKN